MKTRAAILWLSSERGGRKAPPSGRYRCDARFEDSRDELRIVQVTPVRSLRDGEMVILAEIEFFSIEAGEELATPGARFLLCEGHRVVAKGVVLPAEVAVPQQIDEFALSLLG